MSFTNNIGWHPAPNGGPELWYWDGHGWNDPVEQVQAQVTELVTPHLERMWRKGFEAGIVFADTGKVEF